MTYLPNLLSGFRIVCVPILLTLAYRGAENSFLLLFGLGLLSDILDGPLARRLGVASEFGARLDQWGDFSLWLALTVSSWWLWHEIVLRESTYVLTAVTAMGAPTLIAYAKYRAVPGYHTWSVKSGAFAMAVAVPLLLIFDIPVPFRCAALFQIVCALDELAITALLDQCQHDIPSAWYALGLRKLRNQG